MAKEEPGLPAAGVAAGLCVEDSSAPEVREALARAKCFLAFADDWPFLPRSRARVDSEEWQALNGF
eukprot:11174764-Lingulodinium_polyedra.AAC.1